MTSTAQKSSRKDLQISYLNICYRNNSLRIPRNLVRQSLFLKCAHTQIVCGLNAWRSALNYLTTTEIAWTGADSRKLGWNEMPLQ